MNVYFCLSDTPLDKSCQREWAIYLLDYAVLREFGVATPEVVRGEHGKPYFKDSDIFFNCSHCKYGVACVVGSEEVGVDIQEIRLAKPAVIKRVCCVNELALIKNDDDFIKAWVQKEAYAKFTGKGFAESFVMIDTTTFPKGLVFKQDNCYIACYTAAGAMFQRVRVSPVSFPSNPVRNPSSA